MTYFCNECKRDIDNMEVRFGCAYCGSKIVRKKRPGIARELSTD